ncbi:MAG TPA: YcxB family protein [Burkholderiaceae bacterium]|jgi:hypothetical protein|nr:YcxB family protein [Burkholderiaceae bacterium]
MTPAQSPDSATITFQLPRDELVRTLWRRVVSRPRYLQSMGLFFALALIAMSAGPRSFYVGLLLFFYVLARPWAARQAIARNVDANTMLTDERTVEFGPAGISAAGPDWKTSVPWRYFKVWSEDDRNFYLEVGVVGLASIIPKRVMTDQQRQLLRMYLASIPGG